MHSTFNVDEWLYCSSILFQYALSIWLNSTVLLSFDFQRRLLKSVPASESHSWGLRLKTEDMEICNLKIFVNNLALWIWLLTDVYVRSELHSCNRTHCAGHWKNRDPKLTVNKKGHKKLYILRWKKKLLMQS